MANGPLLHVADEEQRGKHKNANEKCSSIKHMQPTHCKDKVRARRTS